MKILFDQGTPTPLSTSNSHLPIHHYKAAGGVVVHNQKVLVLYRPQHQEVRLPKGHIEAGEQPAEAALREVKEESGYQHLKILADLGQQTVAFDHNDEHIVRTEYYFLMGLVEEGQTGGEGQFEPIWLSWEAALKEMTFHSEQEWIRRAKQAMNQEMNW